MVVGSFETQLQTSCGRLGGKKQKRLYSNGTADEEAQNIIAKIFPLKHRTKKHNWLQGVQSRTGNTDGLRISKNTNSLGEAGAGRISLHISDQYQSLNMNNLIYFSNPIQIGFYEVQNQISASSQKKTLSLNIMLCWRSCSAPESPESDPNPTLFNF